MEINYRADGRIEVICVHGVGHTIYNPHNWGKYTYSHGCCAESCCTTEEFKKFKDGYKLE